MCDRDITSTQFLNLVCHNNTLSLLPAESCQEHLSPEMLTVTNFFTVSLVRKQGSEQKHSKFFTSSYRVRKISKQWLFQA